MVHLKRENIEWTISLVLRIRKPRLRVFVDVVINGGEWYVLMKYI